MAALLVSKGMTRNENGVGVAHPTGRSRTGAVIAAVLIECGLVAIIVWGLAAHPAPVPKSGASIVAVRIAPDPPPDASPDSASEPEAAAALPLASADPAPAIVPSPRIDLAPPAAAKAASGPDGGGAEEGAGSGGIGTGAGTGAGTGSAPVRIAGALGDRDYPRGANGAGGTVAIAYRVRADGRVDRCRVISSSAGSLLDALTCELVQRRFRYQPARDASGRAVEADLRTRFTWGSRVRG